MTNDELRDAINAEPEDIAAAMGIERDRSGRGYVCPECGSGSGPNGTGPTLKNGRFHCWACDWGGDAVDVIQRAKGCAYVEALDVGASVLGMMRDGHEPRMNNGKPKPKQEPEPLPDFTDDLKCWADALPGSDGERYLQCRGISLETARRYGVGYEPAWRSPSVPLSIPTSPRVIFPFSRHAYQARDIRPLDAVPDSARRYVKQSAGRAGIFGADALDGSDPVFVTEGQMDALSVAEVGGPAVAIGGTSGVDRLVRALEKRRASGHTIPPLILSLDVDANDAGQTAQNALRAALDARGMFYTVGTLYGPTGAITGAKDANEALQHDRTAFADAVARDIQRANAGAAEWEPLSEAEQLEAAEAAERAERVAAARFDVDAFLASISAGSNARIPTGIGPLDDLLGGGLYPGLVMLGARTGIGKTTLALQIADHIAASGHPVLYAALEMDRAELAAKSIARLHNETAQHAITFGSILDGTASGPAVERAARAYAAWASRNMHVVDVTDGPTMGSIERLAHDISTEAGTAPVVIVDYLQLLRPADSRLTAKDATDANALALKRLNKALKTPVIAISSFNRASYGERVRDGNTTRDRTEDEWFDALEAAFKESGGIEYTADVMLALRPVHFDGPRIDERLYVVKNRRGARHVSLDVTMHGDTGWYTVRDEVPYSGGTPWTESMEERRRAAWERRNR